MPVHPQLRVHSRVLGFVDPSRFFTANDLTTVDRFGRTMTTAFSDITAPTGTQIVSSFLCDLSDATSFQIHDALRYPDAFPSTNVVIDINAHHVVDIENVRLERPNTYAINRLIYIKTGEVIDLDNGGLDRAYQVLCQTLGDVKELDLFGLELTHLGVVVPVVVISRMVIEEETERFEFVFATDYVQYAAWVCQRVLQHLEPETALRISTLPRCDPRTVRGLRPFGNVGYADSFETRVRRLQLNSQSRAGYQDTSPLLIQPARERPMFDARRDLFEPEYRYSPLATYLHLKSPSEVLGHLAENPYLSDAIRPFVAEVCRASEKEMEAIKRRYCEENKQDADLYQVCVEQILWERRANHNEVFRLNSLENNTGNNQMENQTKRYGEFTMAQFIPNDLTPHHAMELLQTAVQQQKSVQMILTDGSNSQHTGMFTPNNFYQQGDDVVVAGQFFTNGYATSVNVMAIDYVDACFQYGVFKPNQAAQRQPVMSPRIQPHAINTGRAPRARDPYDDLLDAELKGLETRPTGSSTAPNPFDNMPSFTGFDTPVNQHSLTSEEMRKYVLKDILVLNGEPYRHTNGAPAYQSEWGASGAKVKVAATDVLAARDQIVALAPSPDAKLAIVLADGRWCEVEFPTAPDKKIEMSRSLSTLIFDNRKRIFQSELASRAHVEPSTRPRTEESKSLMDSLMDDFLGELTSKASGKPAPAPAPAPAQAEPAQQQPAPEPKRAAPAPEKTQPTSFSSMLTAASSPAVRETKVGRVAPAPAPAPTEDDDVELDEDMGEEIEIDRSGAAPLVVKTKNEDRFVFGGILVDISNYASNIAEVLHLDEAGKIAACGVDLKAILVCVIDGKFDLLPTADQIGDTAIQLVCQFLGAKNASGVFPWLYRSTSQKWEDFDSDAVQTVRSYFTMLSSLRHSIRQSKKDAEATLLQVALAHYDQVCGGSSAIDAYFERESKAKKFLDSVAEQVVKQEKLQLFVKPAHVKINVVPDQAIYESQMVALSILNLRCIRWVATQSGDGLSDSVKTLLDIRSKMTSVVLQSGTGAGWRVVQDSSPEKDNFSVSAWFALDVEGYIRGDLYTAMCELVASVVGRQAAKLFRLTASEDEVIEEMIDGQVIQLVKAHEYDEKIEEAQASYNETMTYMASAAADKQKPATIQALEEGQRRERAMVRSHDNGNLVVSHVPPTCATVGIQQQVGDFTGNDFVLKLVEPDELDKQLAQFFSNDSVAKALEIVEEEQDYRFASEPPTEMVFREIDDTGEVKFVEQEDHHVDLPIGEAVKIPTAITSATIDAHTLHYANAEGVHMATVSTAQSPFVSKHVDGEMIHVVRDVAKFIHNEKPMHVFEVVELLKKMAVASIAGHSDNDDKVHSPLAVSRAAHAFTMEANRYIQRVAGFPGVFFSSILYATKEKLDALVDDTVDVSCDLLEIFANLVNAVVVTDVGEIDSGEDQPQVYEYVNNIEVHVSLPTTLQGCELRNLSNYAKTIEGCSETISALLRALDFYFSGMAPEFANMPVMVHLQDGVTLEVRRRHLSWVCSMVS